MTFAAIFLPNWISWDARGPGGIHFWQTIGLHQSCSSIDSTCERFPQPDNCEGEDRSFCSMWRSVGFLMSFAAVLELVTLVAYCVVLLGGKQRQVNGWRVLAFLLTLIGVVQCASMAIVVCLFEETLSRALAKLFRLTCSITMIDSLWGGNWTSHGFFAQSAGASPYSQLHSSRSRLMSFLPSVAMSLFQANVAEHECAEYLNCIRFHSRRSSLTR